MYKYSKHNNYSINIISWPGTNIIKLGLRKPASGVNTY